MYAEDAMESMESSVRPQSGTRGQCLDPGVALPSVSVLPDARASTQGNPLLALLALGAITAPIAVGALGLVILVKKGYELQGRVLSRQAMEQWRRETAQAAKTATEETALGGVEAPTEEVQTPTAQTAATMEGGWAQEAQAPAPGGE